MTDSVEIAVLGSGVAGAAIAYELRQRNREVALLYRAENEGSSFTNQKWQHSGLLYPDREVAAQAWREFQASEDLLGKFAVPDSQGARFLALHQETLKRRKSLWNEWDVRAWGLDWSHLEGHELAETHAVGGFRVPDRVIDFPALVRYLRENSGATLVPGAEVTRLCRNRSEFTVHYNDAQGAHTLRCKQCVVATGAWSVELLQRSGVRLPKPIRKRCVVLTFPERIVPSITTCFDVQKADGSRGDVTLVPYQGVTIACGTSWQPTTNPDDLHIADAEVDALLAELLQCFPDLPAPPVAHICIKTERATGTSIPDVNRQIYDASRHGVDDLVVAFPGKASFMFMLAKDVADRMAAPRRRGGNLNPATFFGTTRSPSNISLLPIDDHNRDACVALSVSEAQSKLIAPNGRSLDWADANPRCVPLGICINGDMVGFAMYEPRGNDVYSVHRLMIDERHQRRGVGLAAMQLLMERIASLGGKTIYLSFRPENVAAQRFYEELDFVFHEEEPDGELIYRWGPIRDVT